MKYIYLLCFCTLVCCTSSVNTNPLDEALKSEAPEIKIVMDSIDQYNVQIKLSTISRHGDSVAFEDYEFQVDPNTYFYPASSVKFPVSVLVLEKLSQEQHYTIDTPFYVEGDTLATTFRHEIEDIFAVSSNDTYNRLFDYYGKDNINAAMKKKGLELSRFSHRLSTDDAHNLATRPLIFVENDSILTTTQSIINQPIKSLEINGIVRGVGYYQGEELINKPFDFSKKNYLPIKTLHETMKRVIFPENYSENEQFSLSKNNREFLLNAMTIYPEDAGYTDDYYYDAYGKFFMFGDSKDPIPDHFKIYNKVGYAYGFLTDCAYIKDTEQDIEFILTATIHVNKNGIFNDDNYEYDAIGIPFLAELGREIHAQLLIN